MESAPHALIGFTWASADAFRLVYDRIGNGLEFDESKVDEELRIEIASILVDHGIAFNMTFSNLGIYNPEIDSRFVSTDHLRKLAGIDIEESEELLQKLMSWRSSRVSNTSKNAE